MAKITTQEDKLLMDAHKVLSYKSCRRREKMRRIMGRTVHPMFSFVCGIGRRRGCWRLVPLPGWGQHRDEGLESKKEGIFKWVIQELVNG